MVHVDDIGPEIAEQHGRCRGCEQAIVALAAEGTIITLAAVERYQRLVAVDQVVALVAVHEVGARPPVKVSAPSPRLIASGAGRAGEVVVAGGRAGRGRISRRRIIVDDRTRGCRLRDRAKLGVPSVRVKLSVSPRMSYRPSPIPQWPSWISPWLEGHRAGRKRAPRESHGLGASCACHATARD